MATAAREAHTAVEIRAEVHRRVHEGELVKDDGALITVPLPTARPPGVVDENGSNWTMLTFGNATGYEGWVLHCVVSVQSIWDLQA